jgi:hypothetical protein
LNVVDISDFDNIQMIHYEEEWGMSYDGWDIKFGGDDGNSVVIQYRYCDSSFKNYYLGDKSVDVDWDDDYYHPCKEVIVTLKKNEDAVYDEKGKNFLKDGKFLHGDNGNLQDTKYGTLVNTNVSKMIVISEIVNDIEQSTESSE